MKTKISYFSLITWGKETWKKKHKTNRGLETSRGFPRVPAWMQEQGVIKVIVLISSRFDGNNLWAELSGNLICVFGNFSLNVFVFCPAEVEMCVCVRGGGVRGNKTTVGLQRVQITPRNSSSIIKASSGGNDPYQWTGSPGIYYKNVL